jgi:hypothetical protein
MSTNKTQQDNKSERKRKTVRLTPDEKRKLNKFGSQYDAQEDAAEALGIKRGAYVRIKELGRGSEDNISIIREKLKDVA